MLLVFTKAALSQKKNRGTTAKTTPEDKTTPIFVDVSVAKWLLLTVCSRASLTVKMAEVLDALALLKISNTPVLSQFLHDCVDDLVGTKQANFDSYNSDIEWTIDDFNKAKKSIQTFYRESVINDEFNFKSNLGENVQQQITDCFEIRKDDIFEALVKEHLTNAGHNIVENFDWRLKWILGSSKLSSIREPLLQVDLHCLKKNKDNEQLKNTVNFELDLEKLNSLIDQLEKAEDELNNSPKT